MDLTPYVEQLRRDLAVAAEAGGDDARALAERLTAPLDSAARLALLDALSAAAGEITSDLAPGSVDVRLRGRDPEFVVTPPPTDRHPDDGGPPHQTSLRSALANAVEVTMGVRSPAPEGDDGGTSRITLRLPEYLKPRIEDAASRAGLSVNGWLVRAVAAAVDADGATGGTGAAAGATGAQSANLGQQFTGWVR